MRRVKFIIVVFLAVILSGCVKERRQLTKAIDYYIERLSDSFISYGIASGERTITEGNTYQVAPLGRLIVVKINEYAGDDEYERLKNFLERKYKHNNRVNRVYINQGGGTVVVDCRRN